MELNSPQLSRIYAFREWKHKYREYLETICKFITSLLEQIVLDKHIIYWNERKIGNLIKEYLFYHSSNSNCRHTFLK